MLRYKQFITFGTSTAKQFASASSKGSLRPVWRGSTLRPTKNCSRGALGTYLVAKWQPRARTRYSVAPAGLDVDARAQVGETVLSPGEPIACRSHHPASFNFHGVRAVP